jgi:DNA repair protein RadC
MQGRERILSEGPSALSEGELLATLLGSGVRGQPAELIAARMLVRGITDLRRMPAGELLAIPGVGEAQAARVLAALELGRRAACARGPERPRLLHAADVAHLLWPRLAHLTHEEFWAVLLSARLEEIRCVRIASGGLTQCSVLPREAFAPALLHGAPAIAFVHNHPSGDPSPSAEDHRLQMLLAEAGQALGVQVVDHLVLAEDGFHSAVEGRVSLTGKTG